MARPRGPGKYDPLIRYLAALPIDEVTLTLAEIEAIVGFALPPTARRPQFWTNGLHGVFGLQPWVRAGWRVVRKDLRREQSTVTFVRVAVDAAG